MLKTLILERFFATRSTRADTVFLGPPARGKNGFGRALSDDAPRLLTSVTGFEYRQNPFFSCVRVCVRNAFVGAKQHAREAYEEVTYCA